MIAALIAAAAVAAAPATLPGLPIGALAPQSLPASGCAAYLFSIGQPPLFVAMAGADNRTLRLSLDGRTIDLPLAEQSGIAVHGFSPTSQYRTAEASATLDMDIVERPNLADGAAVSEATLRIERAGQDGVVIPLAGLVSCVRK